jgi:group I intron endonuclease
MKRGKSIRDIVRSTCRQELIEELFSMKTKKELKEAYAQVKFTMGVFQITNKANGKVFVGSSLDLTAVWYAQKLQLGMGIHPNKELQKDWNHFGAENFTFEILEELKHNDDTKTDFNKEIKALEELLIEEIKPFDDKGYNRRK